MADVVLVNSKFTGTFELFFNLPLLDSYFYFLAGVFHDTFRSLSVVPDVLYPSLNTESFDKLIDESDNVS